MLFLRRMLRIPQKSKKINKTVLPKADTSRPFIHRIRKRQATSFGHVKK